MNPIRKILAPTDLSDLSVAGLRYALEMAAGCGAEVIVYNVITNEETSIPVELADWVNDHEEIPRVRDMIEKRKRAVATLLQDTLGDLTFRAKIRPAADTGLPVERILEKAAEEGADLIVMSTHGRTGLLHMLNGSVTEKVVRRALCPVLTIHPRSGLRDQRAIA